MTGPKRKLARASTKALSALFDAAPKELYGLEVMDISGVAAGSLYPILVRFVEWGWLEARPETIDPSEAGRPARIYYRLTGEGIAAAQRNLDRTGSPVGQLLAGEI